MNGFYTFIPVPEFHPFREILVSSGYIYLIKFAEVVAGILLLADRYVPLALVILVPDVINITVYYLLSDPRNWFVVPVILVLISILGYAYKAYFAPVFIKKAVAGSVLNGGKRFYRNYNSVFVPVVLS